MTYGSAILVIAVTGASLVGFVVLVVVVGQRWRALREGRS